MHFKYLIYIHLSMLYVATRPTDTRATLTHFLNTDTCIIIITLTHTLRMREQCSVTRLLHIYFIARRQTFIFKYINVWFLHVITIQNRVVAHVHQFHNTEQFIKHSTLKHMLHSRQQHIVILFIHSHISHNICQHNFSITSNACCGMQQQYNITLSIH